MIELVWDQRRAGTATVPSGRGLAVGEGADFSPDELVSMAAAACLMRTCVGQATEAGVDVLSFTATARVEGTPPDTHIHVRVQIVTPDSVPERRTRELWKQVLSDSSLACMLGDRLIAEIEVTRLQGPLPPRT